MRSRRRRPLSWSTSYLLRSPLGISTSTSNSSTSSSTLSGTPSGRSAAPGPARRMGTGAVSRTMAPMREARGSKRVGRDLRHPGRRSRVGAVLHWLPVVLVLALLAAGVGAYRYEWGQRYLPGLAADPDTEPEQVLAPAGLDLPEWSPPADDAIALDPAGVLDPARVAAAVSGDLVDPDLGKHVVGAVAPLTPGSAEWTTGDGRYLPASTTKLLTLGAALDLLGPDHTFTTRVVRGTGPRDVVLVGGQVFADALRAAGLRVNGQPQRVVAPAGAEELASVESAPLSQVAERILDVSDNEGAEVVGHQVGLATSGTGSFEAGAAGVLDTLGGLGIDVAGAEVYDGSGLSRRNRVSTSLLIDLVQHAAGPDGEGMRSLVTGMPVAGFTGSLTYRFAEGPAVARGLVRAKTGTLTGVHALAGIAVDRDGQPLAFVFGADKSPPIERYDSQEALDRAAASLASCRCSG